MGEASNRGVRSRQKNTSDGCSSGPGAPNHEERQERRKSQPKQTGSEIWESLEPESLTRKRKGVWGEALSTFCQQKGPPGESTVAAEAVG